ncbi:MAG: glycosyltransferase family 4 protein [Cytophagaceae bacterium]
MYKLFFLISHPIQYYTPWFKELNKGIDLEVLYCSDETISGYKDKEFGIDIKWDVPLLEGYQYTFLKNNSWKPSIYNGFLGLLNFSIINILLKNRKNNIVLVHGWNRATYILTFLVCIFFRVKYIVHAENPLNQELKKTLINRLIKKVFLGFIFKMAYKVCYIGQENKAFFIYYGVQEKQLIFTPYAVNNEHFFKQSKLLNKNTLRTTIFPSIGNLDIVFLFSGKFINKKRPLDLIEAFIALNRKDIGLILMGDGQLRKDIENKIKQNNLNNIFITGFVNQSEIGKYFTAADVFILPSGMGETWGLVVNEAMNFSLPLITSDLVGSTIDLNKDNGIIFKCGDVISLKEAMIQMIDKKSEWAKMGQKSLEIIQQYSNETRTANLLSVLK